MFDVHAKLREMRETVREELKHVPRGDSEQNMFRASYQIMRMNSMGKKAQLPNSKQVVLKSCIDHYKKTTPNFTPQFDEAYFHLKKK
jgi:hypothetical protein